jgi:hypothetical protein
VVAVAGLVRVVVAVAYRPTLVFSDSWTYIHLAFSDEHLGADRPSGYPALLWLVALPGRSLLAVTTLQHLAGLAVGVLVYWLLRRLDVARWAATAATAVVVLNAYAIVLEQMILAEAFFSLALVLGAFLAIGRDRGAWSIAVGGVLLAGATLMRTAGMFAIVVWLAYVAWRHRRVRVVAIATAAAIAPLGVYAAGNAVKKGNFGLTSADGWFLYGRVGEIADCSRFTPPRGTGRLCESAAQRANGTPLSYIWSGRSPANRFYGGPGTPGSSEPLRSFATAVIKARPAAYAGVVARDVLRYFRPGESSAGRSDSAITLPAKPDQQTAPVNPDVRDAFFPGYAPRAHAPADLARAYAAVVHPPRPLLGLLVVATLVLLGHAVFARRRLRAQLQRWPEALLLTGMGMAMLIGTAASSAFVVRYLIPAVPLLVAGGTVALADLARAYRSGRSTART